MTHALFARPALHMLVQTAEFVFDRFIRRPLYGLVQVCESLSFLLPDLAEATVAAVVQAVSAQLTSAGRQRIIQGLQQLLTGLKQFAWPVGLGVVVLVCRFPSIFWLPTLAAVLLFVSLGRNAPIVPITP